MIFQCLEFIQRAENLKNTLRFSNTSAGRAESTAEHTWRLCLMVMVFADEFKQADMVKMLKMCVIHDLGEAIHGDIPAISQDNPGKSESERRDFLDLVGVLPLHIRTEFLALWDDYEHALSYEARLVKGLDKLETIIQHNQALDVTGIDYVFNLEYGKRYMDAHPLFEVLRGMVDKDTASRVDGEPPPAQVDSTDMQY